MDLAGALVAEVKAAGAYLEVSEGRLVVHSPRPLDEGLLGLLRAHREALIAWITTPNPTATVTVWIDEDGQLRSGPLLDAKGQKVEP